MRTTLLALFLTLGGGVAQAQSANRLEAAFFDGGSWRSSDLSKVPFWNDLLRREGRPVIAVTPQTPDEALLARINGQINASRFRDDAGSADHWETPEELRVRGGDCEDFAVAKYFALRAAGVSPDAMWIAVVVDERTNQRHAVLLVQLPGGVETLDNLHSEVTPIEALAGYRPILAVNENAWQLAKPALRQIASR